MGEREKRWRERGCGHLQINIESGGIVASKTSEEKERKVGA